MKINLHDYIHGENGLALEIMPETAVEKELLRAFFHHGELSIGNGPSGIGFRIKWNPGKDRDEDQL